MQITRTISEKGQVVIPEDIRRSLKLKSGSKIVFDIEGNKITIKMKQDPEQFIEEFCNLPKKLKKLDMKGIKKMIEKEYES